MPLVTACDDCGQPIRGDWRHCPFCGAKQRGASEELVAPEVSSGSGITECGDDPARPPLPDPEYDHWENPGTLFLLDADGDLREAYFESLSDESESGSNQIPPAIRCLSDKQLEGRAAPKRNGLNPHHPAGILELLSKIARPLKAREIARFLTKEFGCTVSKRSVNQILYRLKKDALVDLDDRFRWSLLDTSKVTASDYHQPVIPSLHSSGAPSRQKSPERYPLEVEVGHWIFSFQWERDREFWKFRCTLCGHKTQHLVRPDGHVLPLTGELRMRREDHDRAKHPETLAAQAEAENRLLGSFREYAPLAAEACEKAVIGFAREIGLAVDTLMKKPVGYRLMRGLGLLRGED